jgi:sensor histidine kinase YesM
MMEEADKTSYFLEQVADFFRYNIRHQNRETTLTEEIALVDNYIYVMKVRFANRFVFHKQIEAADTSLHVPSMIIQPLVENCIKHGLYDSGKPGVINLHVYVPEDNEYKLCIDISDNGVGFPRITAKRNFKEYRSAAGTAGQRKNSGRFIIRNRKSKLRNGNRVAERHFPAQNFLSF